MKRSTVAGAFETARESGRVAGQEREQHIRRLLVLLFGYAFAEDLPSSQEKGIPSRLLFTAARDGLRAEFEQPHHPPTNAIESARVVK